MKRCPKCKTPNPLAATECDSCGVIFADIRGNKQPTVDRLCPWNDHGHVCGLVGSLSDSTTGSGPWYCSRHYWQLKRYPLRSDETGPRVSDRERWYSERNLEYEPPKLGDCLQFRCIRHASEELYKRVTGGDLGPRQRQPGDDDEVVAA